MRGIVFLIFVAAFVGLIVVLRRNKAKLVAGRVRESLPMVRSFFQRTGYAFADARSAPLEAQAQRWQEAYLKAVEGYPYSVHLARSYNGLELQWQHITRSEYRRIVWSQSWRMALSPPPRVHFHLTERRNTTTQNSGWQPAFQRSISLGDPVLDNRFVLYTPHDERAVQAIVNDPQLKRALLSFAYVDLRVLPDGVTFSDPMQTNLTQMLGGAALKVLVHPGQTFEASLPLHERVAAFMLGAASLAR